MCCIAKNLIFTMLVTYYFPRRKICVNAPTFYRTGLNPVLVHGLVAWCSGNSSDPISEVTVRRVRLILRWVTACGQVNHLGM